MATPNSLLPIPRNRRIAPGRVHKERYPYLDRPHHAILLYTTTIPNMTSPPTPSHRMRNFQQFMAQVEQQQQQQQKWPNGAFQTPRGFESPFSPTGQLPPGLQQIRGDPSGEVKQLFGNEFFMSRAEASPWPKLESELNPAQMVVPDPFSTAQWPPLPSQRKGTSSVSSASQGGDAFVRQMTQMLENSRPRSGSGGSYVSSQSSTPSTSPVKNAGTGPPKLSPIRTELRPPLSSLQPKSPSNPGAFLRYQQQRQLEAAFKKLPEDAWKDARLDSTGDTSEKKSVWSSPADIKGKQKVADTLDSPGPSPSRGGDGTKQNNEPQTSPLKSCISPVFNTPTLAPPGLPVPKAPIIFGDLMDEKEEEEEDTEVTPPINTKDDDVSQKDFKELREVISPVPPTIDYVRSPFNNAPWVESRALTLDEALYGHYGQLPTWMRPPGAPPKIIPLDELSKRTKADWEKLGMWPKKEKCLPGIKWDDKLGMPSGFFNPFGEHEVKPWWDVPVAMASNVDEGIDTMSDTIEQLREREQQMMLQQATERLRGQVAKMKAKQEAKRSAELMQMTLPAIGAQFRDLPAAGNSLRTATDIFQSMKEQSAMSDDTEDQQLAAGIARKSIGPSHRQTRRAW
ncbi:hypothetical protein BDD12DRAFT_894701 [Trichophaea hybrida]|nr:hypothetical protein BDD12DRAFT_894701 [Trichophaea hybrida]